MKKDKKAVSDFRSDAKIIFLALDLLLSQLKSNEVEGSIEEIVHDIRVHFRKLISLVYFYRPLLKKDKYKALNGDLKRLLRSFGYMRNEHVFDMHMQKYMEKSGEDKALLTALLERQEAKKVLLKKEKDHLEPLDFRVLYEKTLKVMLGYGQEIFRKDIKESDGSEKPFILSRYSHLMRSFTKLETDLDFQNEKAIHELRVVAKNIYYTLKAKEEQLGELAVRRGDHLKEVQNIAGRIHDADVHLKILEEFEVQEDEKEVFMRFLDHIRSERELKLTELKNLITKKL